MWVNRYDGHESLANSVTLRLAGITAKTADPAGGQIVRDAQGNPTGVLKDSAQELVNKVMPPMTPAHRMRAIHQAMDHAASLGVTSVQDMNPSYDDVKAYAELQEQSAHRPHLRGADGDKLERPGQARYPPGFWHGISAHGGGKRLCRWIAGINHSLFL